jgi:hypothetical protein
MVFIFTLVLLVFSVELSCAQALICEYNNISGTGKQKNEFLELIVTKDNTSLVGYQLRDYSTTGKWQSAYIFGNTPVWENLRKGTIVVIYFYNSVPNRDVDKSDGYLEVNLDDSQLFSHVGGSKIASMSIAQGGDLIELKNSGGTIVHCIGHGASSSESYKEFNNLGTTRKILFDSGIGSNQSVIVSPGRTEVDYINGTPGEKTSLTNSSTPGLPNSSACEMFWRELREPSWTNPRLTIDKHDADQIELSWYPADGDTSYSGYIILRAENASGSSAMKPVDGIEYTVGDKIGDAEVMAVINDFTATNYTDKSKINCDNKYTYLVYAYRFKDNPSDSYNTHGISYNTNQFGARGVFIESPPKPEIYTDGNKTNICEGDSIIIRLEKSEKFDDCDMIWYDGSTRLENETSDTLLVKKKGEYYLRVENENDCQETSNSIRITYTSEPNVWFVSDDNHLFLNDTTLYVCSDDIPKFSVQNANLYPNKVSLYKNGEEVEGDFNWYELTLSETGKYTVSASRNGCIGYSPELHLNVMNVDFHLTPEELKFDADESPVQTMKIVNRDNTNLLLKKSDFSLPLGFEIIEPIGDEFLVPKKDGLDIKIRFTGDENIEDSLVVNGPCEVRRVTKLIGIKKDMNLDYPKFNETEFDFGVMPTCKLVNKDFRIKLERKQYCLIKTFKDNIEGMDVSFYPSLPCNLGDEGLDSITVTVSFSGSEARVYDETVTIGYTVKNIDDERVDGEIKLRVLGEKTEPILTLDENSTVFDFEIEGCETYVDTVLKVTNSQEYDIEVKQEGNPWVFDNKPGQTPKHIKFIGESYIISKGETQELPVRINVGNYEPVRFQTATCNTTVDKPISINIQSIAPDITFDLSNDTLNFGMINNCLASEPISIDVHIEDNGINGVIESIDNYNAAFSISGITEGANLTDLETIKIEFFENADGIFIDSLVCVINPCDMRKVFYIKAEQYTPGKPKISRDTIDFGNIEIGEVSGIENIVIDNDIADGEDIKLKSFENLKLPFSRVDANDLDYEIKVGESASFGFQYVPSDESTLDECLVTIRYESSCDFTHEILLRGSSYSPKLQAQIKLSFDNNTKAIINRDTIVSLNIAPDNDVKLDECGIKSLFTAFEYDSSVIFVQDVKVSSQNTDAVKSLKWNEIRQSRVEVELDFAENAMIYEGNLFDINYTPLRSKNMKTDIIPVDTKIESDSADFEFSEIGGRIEVHPVCDLGNDEITFDFENDFFDIDKISGNNFKLTIYINQSSLTNVGLFSMTGQKVKQVCDEVLDKGVHRYDLETDDLPSGCYILQFSAKNSNETYKLLIK